MEFLVALVIFVVVIATVFLMRKHKEVKNKKGKGGRVETNSKINKK